MNINIQTNKFDSDFACLLEIIQQHRTQAARAINHASILTAWHVGAYVSFMPPTAAQILTLVKPNKLQIT